MVFVSKKCVQKISIAKAHALLGQGNEEEDSKTVKALGKHSVEEIYHHAKFVPGLKLHKRTIQRILLVGYF